MSGINHIGITVTDIDAAMNWYVNTFGLRVLADSPIHCDTTTEGADRRADVFGEQWGGMKLAHLEADNGGGIELFQFLEPQVEKPGETFPYWLVGTHHVALTVDDFDATLERIVSTGGTQRTRVHDIPTGARVCYCEDPWGNVVEIVSTTYAQLVTAPAA